MFKAIPAFFANILGVVLNIIYNVVGNYGIAIIIFSVLIKLIMVPTSIKQQKNMKKSLKIQEKMKEIQAKYKNNPQKLNEETMELYKKENMSPFSGCSSLIVNMIVIFSVFFIVSSPLTYMKKVNSEIIDKYTKIIQEYKLVENTSYAEINLIREIENIRALRNTISDEQKEDTKTDLLEIKDEELDQLKINMEFLGLDLSQVPTKSKDWKAYIIPILYVVVSILSLKITNPTQSPKNQPTENKDEKALAKNEEDFDPMDQMNKNMNLMFPIMYIMIAIVAPLGLALYWLTNSLLMIVERLAINKLLKDEEEK